MHNHCFQFLLGITGFSRKTERHKLCAVNKVYYLGNVKWWIERKAANNKFLNDYDGIGKISLKPEQSSKRNPRRLTLLNSSLMIGKEGIKLTPQGVGRNTRLLVVFVLVYVQVRHQVDLLDLGKCGRVKLQIEEFFSTFLATVGSFGLDHLKVKIAEHAVSAELKAIYIENGPPFWYCKVTKVLNLKQPLIPFPVSRKIRSHCALLRSCSTSSKMEYDFIKMEKKGLNWTRALAEYQMI